MNASNHNQHSHKNWPAEVANLYNPARTLGTGGFAYVMLAQKKSLGPQDEKLVAIKIVGTKDGVSRTDLGYARRETDILKEISHPNIMRLINYWEPEPNSTSVAAMALGYARGPTVESLLQHGGALSSTFGRIVIAQVIDAVSFLHSRAVVHRDIKPDNIIVTGASSQQGEVWDNDEDTTSLSSWEDLRQKWHVTLIDFGFARALTPEDVVQVSPQIRRENLNASYHSIDIKSHATRQKKDGDNSSHASIEAAVSLDSSLSRRFVRQMSALGSRNFSAPEIMKGIVNEEPPERSVTISLYDITETLSTSVSEYGLLVDAYSLGHTMRYIMTGVPPRRRVQDAIAEQKSLMNRFSRWTKKNISSKSLKRKVRYRCPSELPVEAQQLIKEMTMVSEDERLSVRGARRYLWVADVLPKRSDHDDKKAPQQEVSYLKCALEAKQAATESVVLSLAQA